MRYFSNTTGHKRILSFSTRTFHTSLVYNMIVKPVPCLKDNYSYLLLDEKTKTAGVVDPVEPDNVLTALEDYPDYKLTTVLTTHHHWDHAGGNTKLLKKRPGLTVYGGSKQVQGVTEVIESDKHLIKIGDLKIQPFLTRGHTMDHVCYYVQDEDEKAVFTGDCLFSSGCGRFFEGTPKDMDQAFSKLKNLPEQTNVYFGHEYTVANCNFASKVEPNNSHLQQKLNWAKRVGCTTPSTILNESLTNPFLRVHESTVREAVIKHHEDAAKLTDIDVLGRLRQMKDNA
ncbi:hydroxyacylglutathione hydrolase [Halteromyces radiatus]|uniref:hydroxyacylglutathione hydrolase n=1 Tax=Halteromyces radiatus TaxID=101107 RepID=UPI00221FED9E|nr:hydroxyacylglutathione hydrolase [Halteromyces radiatus]KAI8081616.1 hydroxyacylglutathione hydrolase [Halteromyces radiatus]